MSCRLINLMHVMYMAGGSQANKQCPRCGLEAGGQKQTWLLRCMADADREDGGTCLQGGTVVDGVSNFRVVQEFQQWHRDGVVVWVKGPRFVGLLCQGFSLLQAALTASILLHTCGMRDGRR